MYLESRLDENGILNKDLQSSSLQDHDSSQIPHFLQSISALSELTFLLHGKLRITHGYNLRLTTKLNSFAKCFAIMVKFVDKIFKEKKALFDLFRELYFLLQTHFSGLSFKRIEFFTKCQINESSPHRFIKEMTIRGLEPQIEKLITQHNQQIRNLKSIHELELTDIKVKLRNTLDEEIIAMKSKYQAELTSTRERIKEESFLLVRKDIKRRQNVLSIFYRQEITSILKELNFIISELIVVKENYKGVKNTYICEWEKFRIKIFQEIIKNRAKQDTILNVYWQGEVNSAKVQIEEFYKDDFVRKKQTVVEKCRKNNDENIEILITNLERKFNEMRYVESVQQNENMCLLKNNYERQLTELILKNKKIETEHAVLLTNSQILESELAIAKEDLNSHPETLTLANLKSFESQIHTSFREKHGMEEASKVYLENIHLKNYIRGLELKHT